MRRVAEVVAVLALGCALVLALWFVALLVFFQACDAEVGLVDASSPAGRLCESPVGTAWVLLALIGPVAAALAIAAAVLRRRRLRRPVIWSLAGIGLLGVVGAVMLALPSSCTNAQYRAYERWQENSSNGDPPAECDSY